MPDSHTPPAEFSIDSTEGGEARLRLSGDWSTVASLPSLARLEEALAKTPAPVVLKFDAAQLTGWNTRLLAFVLQCRELCEARQVTFDPGALPDGLQRLVTLYLAVPARLDAKRSTPPQALLHRIGVAAQELGGTVMDLITFCGECVLASGQWVRGRARFRTADLFLIMQQTGPQALGIVALINFMVGLILAFLGAVQLKQFGAAILLADMVAVGAVRELSPIMTGIIVSGRTGAAFAAQLGTMKVNEEIDAFTSFGFPPVEFLVLPRLVALLVTMPLLCVFAAFIAILGGFTTATLMLDISTQEYLSRTVESLNMSSFLMSIFKGGLFGLLVGMVGCWRGMRCGRDAAAVGLAATSAVVLGIAGIVAANGLLAMVFNVLGI